MKEKTVTERCFECGSKKVAHHKFWCGDLLPMCRACFEEYILRAREARGVRFGLSR